MGAVASLNIGEVVQILQQWHQYQRDETWSRRGYDIGLQSMRIDILNTVREEMRDQVTVIISSLDNLMVVATLMLSIGFGFAVEGTFPPAESDYEYDELQRCLLMVYALLSALSLVFPLACLMLTIAARFEVELCQQDVMGDLQKHLLKALQKDKSDIKVPLLQTPGRRASKSPNVHTAFARGPLAAGPDATPSEATVAPSSQASASSLETGTPMVMPFRSQDRRPPVMSAPLLASASSSSVPLSSSVTNRQLPLASNGVLQPPPPAPKTSAYRSGLFANAASDRVEGRETATPAASSRPKLEASKRIANKTYLTLKSQLGTLVSEDHVGHIAEDEVRLIAEGLLQKVNHYHTLYPIAQLFLWLGMLSSVLVCSVLLGLYFNANFPSTPWMWRLYSGILILCAVLSVSFYMWMKYNMLREPMLKTHFQRPPAPSFLDKCSQDSERLIRSTRMACGQYAPLRRCRVDGRLSGSESDGNNFESAEEEDTTQFEQLPLVESPYASRVPRPRFLKHLKQWDETQGGRNPCAS